MTITDVRQFVASCMACHHWQIDVRPGAVSDLGGSWAALILMAEAHAAHLPDCPAGKGRVRFETQWVDMPKMPDGATADGLMQMDLLPRWWVTR